MNDMYKLRRYEAIVYTDGAYSPDIQVGGWSYLILYDSGVLKGSGGRRGRTTCNALELNAVCEAVSMCNNMGFRKVKVCLDSAYVMNFYGDIEKWHKRGWRRNNGKVIKNRSLWKWMYKESRQGIKIEFEKVKAHSGNRYNETVDLLAKGAIKDVCSKKDS